ncbi:2-aminoadipate transaminase OS=Castellaniella defragrans OX=75697 GN=HNR28_000211 PE=4 SV=1 [Castellaniella defragrans]
MDMSTATRITFSQRANQLTSSAIREILKITERPEVISFAGGLPSPEGFPIPELRAAFDQVLDTQGPVALQYGRTEGYTPLREWVAAQMSREGEPVDTEEVLIVSGSQQALDMLGKLFIDPGSRVLVEAPSYLGALQSFSLFDPQFQSVPTDGGGLIPDAVDHDLAREARFIYVLPNFQNPTGLTLNLQRRQALVERCAELGLPIIEDDPYGELRYAGEPQPSLLKLGRAVGATVIRLGTFSKVLAPGLRLGYVVAPRDVISKLVQIKQATDLHTAMVTQMAVFEAVRHGFLEAHLPKVRALYQRQCGYMLDALQAHFPSDAQWTRPEGGMFIWVTLRDGIDTTQLLQSAIARNVAFVPGAPFYAGVKAPANTLRLSFVTVPEARIRVGVEILGELIGPARQ